jgi:RNA polymerase sigma-70 factor, ECF subfamily
VKEFRGGRTQPEVERMTADHRRARFEALAPALIEPLRRYLARRTDPATADDVLSETLLVCWRRLDDMPPDYVPWAIGVARLCLANAERAQRRQSRLHARLATSEPPAHTGDAAMLHTALEALRAPDAELLRLWAWEDLSNEQIATVLGITVNAATIRLHRAKQRLRAQLRKTGSAAGHEEPTEGRRT